MKSLYSALFVCVLALSAGGCVFLDTSMISYGQKADGFEEGVVNVLEVDNLDILDKGTEREVYFLFREVAIMDGE